MTGRIDALPGAVLPQADPSSAGRSRQKVVVALCTSQRPKMLQDCLASLVCQRVPADVALTIAVVENHATDACRGIVERFAAEPGACRFVYAHEPRMGIPIARNRALEVAVAEGAHWIAFTDDDCVAAPNWIAALLDAAKRYDADAVYGRREWIPPDEVPYWFVLPELEKYKEGQALERAATHNILIVASLASQRFDEGHAHGSDTEFFFRASRRGARIVFSERPVVHEKIPPHRATLRYQAVRGFYHGVNRVQIRRKHNEWHLAIGRTVVLLLWQMPIAVLRLMSVPLTLPLEPQLAKRNLAKGIGRLVRTAGWMAGLAGFNGNPYRNNRVRPG